MPRSVQVSVSIPREYIREIVAGQTAKGETNSERIDPHFIEEEVLSKVEQIVSRLIPADSPDDAISVTCVDRLQHDVTDATSSSFNDQFHVSDPHLGKSNRHFGSGPVGLGSLVDDSTRSHGHRPTAKRSAKGQPEDIPSLPPRRTLPTARRCRHRIGSSCCATRSDRSSKAMIPHRLYSSVDGCRTTNHLVQTGHERRDFAA